MHPASIRPKIAAWIILAATSPACLSFADGTRPTSIERYGIGGHIQAIGLHHGFHVETVAAGTPAAKDLFKAHDVIVKVDGEDIRSLDHLRAVLAEAYADDGEVTVTYLRGTSLEHRVAKCHVKPEAARRVAKKWRADPEDGEVR